MNSRTLPSSLKPCFLPMQRPCRHWSARRGMKSSWHKSMAHYQPLSSSERPWRMPTPTPRCSRTWAMLPRPWRLPMTTCTWPPTGGGWHLGTRAVLALECLNSRPCPWADPLTYPFKHLSLICILFGNSSKMGYVPCCLQKLISWSQTVFSQ